MASFTVQAFGTERLQVLTDGEYQDRTSAFERMIHLG